MRYFFFTYKADSSGKFADGNLMFECEKFPNNDEIKEIAKKRCPPDMAVVVTGWKEFDNKEDFDSFNGN